MDVILTTRPKTLGHLVAYEGDALFARERITLLAGSGSARTIAQFAVLGLISVGALSVAAAKTGTGNGVITGSTVAAGAKTGAFVAECIEAATNLGTFDFFDPEGVNLGTITAGTPFTLGGITATIADGSTDWVAGDRVTYTVTAAAGSGKWLPVDPAATDGTQNAAAITLASHTVPDGSDLDVTVFRNGPLIVRAEELAWPAGATSPQIAAWTAQLRALNIKVDVA